MLPDELQAIIAQGETLTVEFKSDRPLSDHDLLEAVVCMANARGGTILVGVEDDGRVTGLHPRHARGKAGHLAALIANRTVPSLKVEVTIIPLAGGEVAVIRVPAATQPVATSEGRTLIRYIDAHGRAGCRPLYPYELLGWYADRGQRDMTAQPVAGATWDDLDPLEFARLRRLVNEYRGDTTLLDLADEELARALGLVRSENGQVVPTLAGLLVVGREQALREHVPAHEVAFQVLRGQEVAVNEFYRWPLLRVFERILEAFTLRNEERELTIGLFRVGVPAYDPRAFREAVNNALTHRDYTRLGAVHVQMHEDRIVVINPGGFVEGVRLDNLLVTGPRPRNPLLADIFKRTGLVERTGRGVGIIFAGQLRTGHLPPDYSRTTEAAVTVVLPGGPADLDFVQVIVTEENRRQHSFTLDELLVLSHLWRERELDTVEAARLIQKGEIEARHVLEGLVEAGLLEGRGRTRGRTYHLSAVVYRRTGRPVAYIHRRGFEPLQMEQMILRYAQAHGQIARRDVVELCRVNENQAAYLLKKLVRQGRLRLVGRGRSAHYELLETGNKNTQKLGRNSESEF